MSTPRPSLFAAFLLLHTVPALAACAQTAGPRIHFTEKAWDFKEAVQGQTLTHHFEFENRGRAPLIISLVRSGCSTCSGAVVDSKVTKPGQKGRIKATFYTGRVAGPQNKRLYVHSNDTSAPYVELTIRGTIKVGGRPAIVVSPETWDAGLVQPGQRRTLSLTVSNVGTENLEVHSVQTSSALTWQRRKDTVSIGKDESASVEVDLDPSKVSGVIQEYAYIQSNDPVSPVKVVQILGYAVSGATQASPSDAVVIGIDRERIRVPGTGRELARTLSITSGLDRPVTLRPAGDQPNVARLDLSVKAVEPGRRVAASLELIDGKVRTDQDGYVYLVIGIPVLTKTR